MLYELKKIAVSKFPLYTQLNINL